MATLSTGYLGRHRTTADTGYQAVAAGNSVGSVTNRSDNDLWVTAASFVGGRSGGTQPDVRISVYDADASKDPTTRLGYFAKVKPSTSMTGAGSGSLVTAAVEQSDTGPTNAAIMVRSSRRVTIDIEAEAQGLGLSVYAADFPTVDNPRIYFRTAPGEPPTDPYNAFSSTNHVGNLTAFLTGYINNPPEAPTGGLYPSGSIAELVPTFTADFDDNNGTWGGVHSGANVGDQLNQYRIQVTSVADTTTLLMNQPFNATPDEQAADAVSQPYNGSALTRGVAYQWRIQVSDQFDAWSDWSAWTTFTPAARGFVTLDGSPTGKILTTTPSFDGRWNHQAATSMTNVQVRLLSKRGTVLQDTGTKVKAAVSSALPGTLFTVSWAQTGFTALSWGQSYQYTMRGYDGSQWSDWSAARTFTTDAAPRIANHLSPDNSQVFATAPLLKFTMTDPDDVYSGSLVGQLYILDPVGNIFLRTATYNPTNSKWEFQTTATELANGGSPNYGIFSWQAFGYDGTLYSGGATVLGSATLSPLATFDYEAGPVVAVSSPAVNAVIAASSLTVSWSVTSGGPQVKYQVYLYDAGTTTQVYASQLITSTATSHVIPSGYIKNGQAYDLVVAVTNGTPVTGNSAVVSFTVAYPAPSAPANFQVDEIPVGNDPFNTAVRITMDASIYATPDFAGITIYRSADGGPDAAEIILQRVTTPAQLQFVDYTPASGYEYTYSATQSVAVGLDILESARVFDTATVTLSGVVLTLMGNGGTYRSCLLNISDLPDDRQINETVYQSPSKTKPVTARAAARYWITAYSGKIVDDDQQPADRRGTATAQERKDELDALDAQNGTVCVRDGSGLKRFGKIKDFKPTRQKGGYFDVSFTVREEDASEGVV